MRGCKSIPFRHVGAALTDTQPVNGYPALFAGGQTPAVPQLLVVGAVDTTGSLWPASMTADSVTVHAPGYKVKRAYLNQQNVDSSGTSVGMLPL